MELKYTKLRDLRRALGCSNCTFMELKLGIKTYRISSDESSNCTFMELK